MQLQSLMEVKCLTAVQTCRLRLQQVCKRQTSPHSRRIPRYWIVAIVQSDGCQQACVRSGVKAGQFGKHSEVVNGAQVFVDTLSGNDVLVSSGSSPIQDVRLSSQVTIVFDDLMNIATLASPQTGNAPFARVLVDPDGNTNDVADQVLVGGSWTAFWDQELYQTTFVFTAEGGFPSSGSALTPRKIVIDLPEQISDLKGNGLDNSGAFIFVPESQPFENVILPADGGEGFADNANHAEAFSASTQPRH